MGNKLRLLLTRLINVTSFDWIESRINGITCHLQTPDHNAIPNLIPVHIPICTSNSLLTLTVLTSLSSHTTMVVPRGTSLASWLGVESTIWSPILSEEGLEISLMVLGGRSGLIVSELVLNTGWGGNATSPDDLCRSDTNTYTISNHVM